MNIVCLNPKIAIVTLVVRFPRAPSGLRGVTIFTDRLPIRITHYAVKKTGLGESIFDTYIKEAIKCYAPEWEIEGYKIDDNVRWVLQNRQL